MIIEENIKTVKFGIVAVGEVFRCGGRYYLKIPTCECGTGYEYNYYDLTNDDYGYLSPEREVIPVKAKLVIE